MQICLLFFPFACLVWRLAGIKAVVMAMTVMMGNADRFYFLKIFLFSCCVCVCVCVCVEKINAPEWISANFFSNLNFSYRFLNIFCLLFSQVYRIDRECQTILKTSNFLKKGKKNRFFHNFFTKVCLVRSCAVWSLDGIWLAKGQSGKGFIDSLPIPFLYSLLCVMGVRRRRISHPPLGGWVVWVSACVRVYTLL